MGEDFCGRSGFQAQRRKRQHVQGPVLKIGLKQPIEREERGQSCRHPKHPAGNAAEEDKIGPDSERHQSRNQREEGGSEAGAPARAEGQPHVTHQKSAEGCHAAPRKKRVASRPSVSWVAMIAIPPSSQCSPISSAASLRPAASSEDRGSSSSQSGRLLRISRARPKRRRCPAERYCDGRSTIRFSPTWPSTPATSIRAPYKAAKNCAFSLTVSCALI